MHPVANDPAVPAAIIAVPHNPVTGLRWTLITLLLLAYCGPILFAAFYGTLNLNEVSWRFEDEEILARILEVATSNSSIINVLEKLILPLLAALTVSSFLSDPDNFYVYLGFIILTGTTLIASLICAYIYAPPGDPDMSANSRFFVDIASSLGVYAMLLVGLKA